MPANRYGTNYRTRDDVFSSITPQNFRQNEISAPAGLPWKPAAWLPVAWTASDRNQGETAFVISKGKPVAQDVEGRLVPAGYYYFANLNEMGGAISDVCVTYTADDVEWGVIDITTGDRVAAAASYTATQVAGALLERGLVREEEAIFEAAQAPALAGFLATDLTTQGGTMTIDEVEAVFRAFLSKPVGVAAYDIHVWGGLPEDGDQYYTNFQMQHAVQFLTEVQMIVPRRAADETTTDTFATGSEVTSGATGDFLRAGEAWTAAALATTTRYEAMGVTASSDLVALGLTAPDPARNTSRTPISSDVTGFLVSEKTSVAGISAEGDWYLDAEAGVLLIHSDTWATLAAGAGTTDLTYSFYAAPADKDDVATAHRFVHFEGVLKAGVELGVDSQSNFVRAGSASDVLKSLSVKLGRVHYAVVEPNTLLDKVKTAYNMPEMSATGKMPGTATSGFSDAITLSQEVVADELAVLLIRI